jgi:hypothetical protein
MKIIIAMHKTYPVPTDDVYLPLQVGALGKAPLFPGIVRDDTGENISEKNPSYCELTGLYWAWKNLDEDAIGLVHYRRHFTRQSKMFQKQYPWQESVLSGKEAAELLQQADIVVPARRRYFIENLYSHYSHTHDGRHLDMAREIIRERCPEYLPSLTQVYGRTWGYMFNMCIMKRAYLDAYCSWLFPVLEELEVRWQQAQDQKSKSGQESVQETGSDFDARFYGRVSEILFNVWMAYVTGKKGPEGGENREDNIPAPRITEVATMHTEPINWWVKGTSFLKAKFFGQKYTKSF